MPDRFWVGGTANWDGTAGTKWATTSGGSGGAAVPTTADDVFFDAASTGTCTIAAGNTGAKSINCTGFTGGIAGTGNITVAGSVTLSAGHTYTHLGGYTITGTGTITTAGKLFPALTINGAGIVVTLGDNFTINGGRIVTVTQGTFDTASYNLSTAILNSSNSNTRSIILGSSTVTLTSSSTTVVNFSTSTNLTFDAGTSQINLPGPAANLHGGSGQTFYNVTVGPGVSNISSTTISGANTFNNLSLVPQSSTNQMLGLVFNNNQTVNGTLSAGGATANLRGFLRSGVRGTPRTITAAAVSADNCDFQDITIAGAAAPISPANGGDAEGNSGIIFPAPKTVYRVGTGTNWDSANSWALTSGGTGANANFPLAQDTAIIDNSATPSSLSLGSFNYGSLDASARTNALSLGNTAFATQRFYGSITFATAITFPVFHETYFFVGSGTQTFTSAGKLIAANIIVDKPSGAFELGDSFTMSGTTRIIQLTRGTFDAKNYNVTVVRFDSVNSNVRTLNMGSGLWTLTGNSQVSNPVWGLTTTTNLTLNKGTADILLSDTTASEKLFSGGGLSYNKLTIGGATGTSVTRITGANSFTELASTKPVAHTVRLNANQTIGTWSVTGTSGNVVVVDSSAAGTRRTITLASITNNVDYLNVRDIGVTDANRFYVGANSTDSGNNLNVIFTDAPGMVDVTGVFASGEVGSVSVSLAADVTADVTGVFVSAELGTVSLVGTALTTLFGLDAMAEVGAVEALPSIEVPVLGVETTADAGTVGITAGAMLSVSGLFANSAVGSVGISAGALAVAAGVEVNGRVGFIPFWSVVSPGPATPWTDVAPSGTNAWTVIST
jgi:hypothetical protein